MPFGTRAPSASKRLRVAQEVDDLLQLRLRLVESGDVVPGDRGRRAGRDLHRLDARHQLHRLPEQADDRAHEEEEEDRQPRRARSPGHEAAEVEQAVSIVSVIGSDRRRPEARNDRVVEGREPDPGLAPGGEAGAVRASSSPREASSTNMTRTSAREQPADRRVVADVGGDAEHDDLVRVEQLEQPVGVRVREDVEVLLQQQELAAARASAPARR